MNITKKSSILKFIRATSMLVGFTIAIGSYDADAKLPLNVFKGVTYCFQDGKKYLTPTIGMAALDGGVIENLRFYGNYTPAYKKDLLTGAITTERDYANDYSNDPIWRMVRILFPSTAGHLSAESSHLFNFGKYVTKPETVALLLNYANEIRYGQQKNLKDLQEQIKKSILSDEVLDSNEVKEYNQKNPANIFASRFENETLTPLFRVISKSITDDKKGDAKDEKEEKNVPIKSVKQMTELFTNRFSSEDKQKLKNVGLDELISKTNGIIVSNGTPIVEANTVFSISNANYQKAIKNPTTTDVEKNQLSAVLIQSKESLTTFQNSLSKTLSDSVRTYIASNNMQMNDELIILISKVLDNADLAIKGVPIPDKTPPQPVLYPKYTPEQIITAFFSYKFSTRTDIKNLMESLNPQIIDEQKVSHFNVEDVLKERDLEVIANKAKYDADDILALETSDVWSMLTPYRVGSQIISNGNTQRYDRQDDKLHPTGTFADCAEVAARHLLNFFLYDREDTESNKPIFNLGNITKYVESKGENPYFPNFIKFYEIQNPDLANDGSLKMRSLWNTVLGDMNTGEESGNDKITYVDDKNELETGYINLMKVFKKLFSLDLSPTPAPTESLETKKKWLEDSFALLFGKLNPNRQYELNLDKLKESGQDKEEISGTMVITVKDQKGEELYSFNFYSKYLVHSEIEDFTMITELPFVDYSETLKKHDISFTPGTAEDAIWFLSIDRDLKLSKRKTSPFFYQVFTESLADNSAIIQFLKRVNRNYLKHEKSFDTTEFKNMLKLIIGNLTLDDPYTFNNAAVITMELGDKTQFKKVIEDALKTVNMGGGFNTENLSESGAALLWWILNLNNATLTTLTIEVDLDERNIQALAESLKINNSLRQLDFLQCHVGGDAKPFFEALKDNRSLTALNLEHAYLGEEGTQALAEALKINNSLTTLHLGANNIGDTGLKALAEMLKGNSYLTSLEIEDNNVDNEGAGVIAEALTRNNTLKSLSLYYNNIGDEGALALAEALKSNKTLTSLNLETNYIGDQVKMLLREAWGQGNRDRKTDGLRLDDQKLIR